MSENQSSSGAPETASGDSANKDTVSYDSYRKLLSEAKKAKEELAVLKAEKDTQYQSQLAEQGKFKEIAEKLQKELKQKDDEVKKKEMFFAHQNLKQSVFRYAKELGAIDETAAKQIFTVAKSEGLLDTVEVKDDYSVNDDQIKNALVDLQKKSPWFFQKKADPPKDVVMGSSSSGSLPKDLTKLDYDKLIELAKIAKS